MAPYNQPQIIIGLGGAAGSGKSFLAQLLAERYGFKRFSFADTLKAMLRALLEDYGLNELAQVRYIEGDLKEEPCPALHGRSCRYAMQQLGTEWGRERIHPRLWTNLLGARIMDTPRVVVDDVRMGNEAEYLLDCAPHHAFIFRVVPKGTPPRHPGSHASEVPLPASLVTADIYHDYTHAVMLHELDTKIVPVIFGGGLSVVP